MLDPRALRATANQKKNDVVDDVASRSEFGTLLMQAYGFEDRVKVVNTTEITDIADDNVVGVGGSSEREARLFRAESA